MTVSSSDNMLNSMSVGYILVGYPIGIVVANALLLIRCWYPSDFFQLGIDISSYLDGNNIYTNNKTRLSSKE